MLKKLRLITALITVMCVAVLAGGCAGKEASSHDFKVGTWKTAQTIQPFVYEKYLGSDDKIDVVPFTNPGDQKAALLAGDLDLCGTTMVTAIMAASKGEPIKIVASMTNKCSALVVAKDSGIENAEDLKGKAIGYVPGTMHHILLMETLQRAGLDINKDVTLKRIDFFDMGQALSSGQIDAFCSGEPYPSIAVAQGYGKVLEYPYYDESVGFINAAIITTDDKIANDKEGVQKLVTAHVKSTDYLMSNKSEWLDKAAEFGTDRAVLEIAADNMELAWDVTPEMIEQTKRLAERMKELGLITEVPDVEAMFDLSFLEHAKSELK